MELELVASDELPASDSVTIDEGTHVGASTPEDWYISTGKVTLESATISLRIY